MPDDFLTCPFCQAKMHPEGTENLPGESVVECTNCQNQFTLGEARPTRLVRVRTVPGRPRQPAGGQFTTNDQSGHSVSTHTADMPYRQTIATQVIVRNESNSLGTAAFVTSIVALFTGGCLSPIALIFSVIAMQKPPKGMAAAGLVISLVGLIPAAFLVMTVIAPMLVVGGLAASQVGQSHPISSVAKNATGEREFSATISHVRQTPRAAGDRSDIEFQLKNTSQWPISRVSVKVQFNDTVGSPIAFDTVSASVPEPIKPGETRKLVFTPSYKSPLRSEMPSSARGTATLVSAE